MLNLGVLGGANSTTLRLSSCPSAASSQLLSSRKPCRICDDDVRRRRFGRMRNAGVVATAAPADIGAGDIGPAPRIEDRPLVGRLMTTARRTGATPSYDALAAASVSAPALIEEARAEAMKSNDGDKIESSVASSLRNVASLSDNSTGGSAGGDPDDYTVLQKHVAYFDRNQDGVVYPSETFEGFRALGFPVVISVVASIVINVSFSHATYDSWVPDVRFPIYIESIHRTKHGSDTDVYDREGKFVQTQFDEMFNRFARTYPDKMSYDELMDMSKSRQHVNDFFGQNANKLEWQFTHTLAKDSEGFASKDAIRGVYDGSFFSYIEDQLKKKDTTN